jgi:putative permease
MDAIRDWFRRHFSDPEVVFLTVLLVGGLLFVVLLGRLLAPLIASLVIAYILGAPIESLRRMGLPRPAALAIVFLGFLTVLLLALLAFLPLLSQQVEQVVRALPGMFATTQELLLALPERMPDLVDRQQVEELMARIRGDALDAAQGLLAFSVAQLGGLVSLGVYLFIVPFLVFFMLKDKDRILQWFQRFLPGQRSLATQIWIEVDRKLGAYVRGKIYEVGIVGSVTWVVFTLLGVDFALLLAVLTGLSVLIPYVGVVAVTLPVALAAVFQFGWSAQFAAVMGAYLLIQLVDGNLLAPLLISEVVDIHPIAVIGSILLFGGLFGFWGVFFAVPLATLVAAVIHAWPSRAGLELPTAPEAR